MIVLVRHGQTTLNAQGRLVGRLDPPLTELGRAQAAAVAAMVGPVARVIASPLSRAVDTALAFGAGQPEIDERWIEMDYGDFDGMPFADVPGAVWRTWRADPSFEPPGGGESLNAVGERVAAACAELLAGAGTGEGGVGGAAEQDVVVVSHVSPIKAAVAWALGVDQSVAFRMRLDNASVTRIGPGPTLHTFNLLPAPPVL